VTYEGTNQVKDAKINMLVREYEMFSMKENKNISGMFVRFTNIIRSLQSLNKCYPNSEMVRKILRCLPKNTIKKKKAMLATWSDSDESSSEEEEDQEIAQIALMAINDSDKDEHEDEE
ncbi:UBN2 domain-containing protein, partial [Cephalotus follicularis]